MSQLGWLRLFVEFCSPPAAAISLSDNAFANRKSSCSWVKAVGVVVAPCPDIEASKAILKASSSDYITKNTKFSLSIYLLCMRCLFCRVQNKSLCALNLQYFPAALKHFAQVGYYLELWNQ